MLSYEKESRNLGTIQLVGGETLVTLPVQFSRDSRHFFYCGGNKIYVYSTETGQLVRELKEHAQDITGFSVNSKNDLQLVSCCNEGLVIVWDYTDGALLKKLEFSDKLLGVFSHPNYEDSLFIIKKIYKGKRWKPTLIQVHLTKTDENGKPEQKNLFKFTGLPKHCCFSKKGRYIAYLHKRGEELGIWDTKANEAKSFLYKDSLFTCVAFHPNEACVAAGDQNGRIIIWQGIETKKPVTMQLHWHAHPLASVAFTHDGSYMISGGQEAVLVLWQYSSNSRQFLPRMGSPIKHVACSHDDSVIAVSHEDNVIKLVSGIDLSPKHTIQGLRKSSYMQSKLVFDPRTGTMVLNSMPGILQFYDPYLDKGIFVVDVVKQNLISQTEDEKLFFTLIHHVAFSETGDWMATVEHRKDHCTTEETRLKFWEFNATNQCYSINTIIDTPHDHRTVAVQFQPASQNSEPTMAVTAGHDGKFKVWVLNEKQGVAGTKFVWACQSVGYYNDTPCLDAVFSEDGQLLAIPYAQVITLWTPNANVLQKTLHLPFPDDKIRFTAFGFKSSSHYLMVSTAHYLIVWNLLTCSVLWTIEANVGHLISDPNTKHFAAFVNFDKKTHLYIFDPSTPNPVAIQPFVSCKAPVFSAGFDRKVTTLSSQDRPITLSKLFFRTRIQELFTLVTEDENDERERTSVPSVVEDDSSAKQDFFNIFGMPSKSVGESTSVQPLGKVVQGDPKAAAIREMMRIPSHVLPPVSTLCSSFLKSMLVSKEDDRNDGTNTDKQGADDDDSMVDEDSESETEATGPVVLKSQQIKEAQEMPFMDTDDTDLDEVHVKKKNFDWLKDVFLSHDK
ncbi:WD repeat-containing protein 75-like [Actinia tenebrosa]|uniref:WD repeat-containing protein 75-like n=1 Tax=Actinia tenebrosa TaxID=6105 RepID=A0A6P8H8E9_ACTTE|nr:WD repeat-containing protein 75-like [Actinia tenebrosa]